MPTRQYAPLGGVHGRFESAFSVCGCCAAVLIPGDVGFGARQHHLCQHARRRQPDPTLCYAARRDRVQPTSISRLADVSLSAGTVPTTIVIGVTGTIFVDEPLTISERSSESSRDRLRVRRRDQRHYDRRRWHVRPQDAGSCFLDALTFLELTAQTIAHGFQRAAPYYSDAGGDVELKIVSSSTIPSRLLPRSVRSRSWGARVARSSRLPAGCKSPTAPSTRMTR